MYTEMFSQDTLLYHHLRYNHYPPINDIFFDAAQEAITLANAGKWNTKITLPHGVKETVSKIVEGMYLESFIDSQALYDSFDE